MSSFFQHNNTHKFSRPVSVSLCVCVSGRFPLFAPALQLHALILISIRSRLLEDSKTSTESIVSTTHTHCLIHTVFFLCVKMTVHLHGAFRVQFLDSPGTCCPTHFHDFYAQTCLEALINGIIRSLWSCMRCFRT